MRAKEHQIGESRRDAHAFQPAVIGSRFSPLAMWV
jgi:hypothetical protein